MAQLLVRDLAPKLIERLKKKARQHNHSLQDEVKHIIEEEARKITMEEARAAAANIRKSLATTGKKLSDSTRLLCEDRDR